MFSVTMESTTLDPKDVHTVTFGCVIKIYIIRDYTFISDDNNISKGN